MAILRDLWNGIFAVGGAGAVSQGPAFMQQYLQRLGGTVDGMKRVTESMDQVPATLSAQIASLQAHEASLIAATPLQRPILFLRDLDQRVLDGTLANFEPAVPLTTEALVYALIGMVLAIALGSLLAWILAALFWRPIFRRRRRFGHRPPSKSGERA